MRIPALLVSALLAGASPIAGLIARPAAAQLVRTIENHDPDRPQQPVRRPGASPTASAKAGPTPRPSPVVTTAPLDFGGSSLGRGGLAPTPNIARWHGRRNDRTLGRSDQVWYANRGWRCRADDGTTGTVAGFNPPGVLYRYARMTGKQALGEVIRAAPSATLGRQVDTGMVVCR